MVHTILFQDLMESLSTPENFLLTAGTEHSSVSEFKMNIISFSNARPKVFVKASYTWLTTQNVCFHCESLPLCTDQVSSTGSVTHALCIKVDTYQTPALIMNHLGVWTSLEQHLMITETSERPRDNYLNQQGLRVVVFKDSNRLSWGGSWVHTLLQ